MKTVALGFLALVVVGTLPLGKIDEGRIDGDARIELAQFGAMTKKRATPAPQRTAAPGTQQNVERRGAGQQQGSPFGGVQK